jgi:hypothetical protein
MVDRSGFNAWIEASSMVDDKFRYYRRRDPVAREGRWEAARRHSVGGRPNQQYGWSGGRRLRGQGVTARVIVVLRDGWLQFRQIGALVPVGIAASKKNQSVRGLVLGRKPHGLLDTDKEAGVLARAVWACPMEIARHHTLYCRGSGLKIYKMIGGLATSAPAALSERRRSAGTGSRSYSHWPFVASAAHHFW